MTDDRLCPFCSEKPERCDLIEGVDPPGFHLICGRCGEWWMSGDVYHGLRLPSSKYHGWRGVVVTSLPKGVGTVEMPIALTHLDDIIGQADTK